MRTVALTLVVGAAGGVLFDLIGLPAAYLSGSMLAVALWAMMRLPADIPDPLRDISFIATGALLGAGTDRSSLAALPAWPISIAALGVSLIVLLVLVRLYLRRVHNYDRTTAILCSVPGALSYVVAVASNLDADSRRVAVVQTVRLSVVVVLIPVLVGVSDVHDLAGGIGKAILSWPDIGIVLSLSILGVPISRLLRVPAPYFTGPMLVSGALFVSGMMEGAVPEYLLWAPLIVCGAAIGTRFGGSTKSFLLSCAKAGFGATALGLAITSLFAWPTALWLDLPFLQLWLAFAPGGLEAMAVLAFTLNVDPAFVAGHQVLRFLAVSLLVPIMLRGIGRKPPVKKHPG